MHDISLRFDMNKAPFFGHALTELITESGENIAWAGSYSVTTEEEYNAFRWMDHDAADKSFDPQTGFSRAQRTTEQLLSEGRIPTFAQVKTRLDELVAEYDSYAGKRERVNQYPAITDQLDMLFHAIDDGQLGESAKTSEFYTTIKTIKDTYQ